MSKDNDDVGYGRPPKHTRFVKGESGNKGRKKKRPEFQTEMVARIRDEIVVVQGKPMTMFELAIRSVFNKTIKSGHSRDLKALVELPDKYGAIPKDEAAAESKAAGQRVMDKILDHFEKIENIDHADVVEQERLAADEAEIVMSCPSCSPTLRKRWNLPERKALGERYGCSGLERDVQLSKKRQDD